MDLTHLTVQGADGSYPVFIGPDALIETLPRFVTDRRFPSAVVITNTTLALYGSPLADRLPGGELLLVPDGEQYKTLDTVSHLYGDLIKVRADRASVIIGLGGGVVGDMAGFVAATFKRGIAYIQAPTSLLAMVDASIGGKVGVDLPQGKNLVGAFKDPLGVFADTTTFATLPEVEFNCGMAEVLKSALVGDPELLDYLGGAMPIEQVIARAAAVKINLVNQDRLEHGPRAYLNLGHTFGHALEQISGYEWRHGEAVAVGLHAAALLSEHRGLCEKGLVQTVHNALVEFGLPTTYSGYDPGALWDAMQVDKKWEGGAARFVLLRGVGQPVMVRDVQREEVIAVLEEIRQ